MPLHVCENERINTAINAAATPTATKTSTSTKPAFADLAVRLRWDHIDKSRKPIDTHAPNQRLSCNAHDCAAGAPVRREHHCKLPFRQTAGIARDEIKRDISRQRTGATRRAAGDALVGEIDLRCNLTAGAGGRGAIIFQYSSNF